MKVMKIRKIFILTFLTFSTKFSALSLCELIDIAMQSNQEIKSAQTNYNLEHISSKTLNAVYAPLISFNSSVKIPEQYKWDTLPNKFSTGISYSNSFPGGGSIGVESSYSFNSMKFQENVFLSQTPDISLNISQSLMPFWIQGKLKDPVKLSLKQQELSDYYQLLQVKKTVLQKLFQTYISTLIAKNEILIAENSITLYDEQIEALRMLKNQGVGNQSKILEIENSKWNAQQNLMSAQSNYLGCIQNLKSLCCEDFDENKIEKKTNIDFDFLIQLILENVLDPIEESYKLKIKLLESNRIYEKQNTAPVATLSVTPAWNLNTTTKENWKTAWEDFHSPDSWSVSVGINLSPMILGTAKQNKKKYKLNYKDAQDAYENYLQQREFSKKQYEKILNHYREQNEIVSNLYMSGFEELKDYAEQYEKNLISKLDFDSVKVRIENCKLNKENIELNVWLYEVLVRLNDKK